MVQNTLILGLQWGDEGKGKIVDALAENSEVVCRFQGGHNAGHTIKVDGEEKVLHLVPSGILHPSIDCVLGNGLVLSLRALSEEGKLKFPPFIEDTTKDLISKLLVSLFFLFFVRCRVYEEHIFKFIPI